MNKPRISIIVAIDEKRGIGKNNDLLFKIHEDMKRLKELTTGHPLIMGRKTFESLGRLLPNRTHIVVTRDQNSLQNFTYQADAIVSSIEEGIEAAKKAPGSDEIFVFGGGQIFKEALGKNLVDRLYVTLVKGDYGANIFFPDYSQLGFTKKIEEEEKESGGYQYTFLTLEK